MKTIKQTFKKNEVIKINENNCVIEGDINMTILLGKRITIFVDREDVPDNLIKSLAKMALEKLRDVKELNE